MKYINSKLLSNMSVIKFYTIPNNWVLRFFLFNVRRTHVLPKAGVINIINFSDID